MNILVIMLHEERHDFLLRSIHKCFIISYLAVYHETFLIQFHYPESTVSSNHTSVSIIDAVVLSFYPVVGALFFFFFCKVQFIYASVITLVLSFSHLVALLTENFPSCLSLFKELVTLFVSFSNCLLFI